MLMGSAFYRLEGPFRQYKRGLLSEDSWEPFEEVIARYMQYPAVLKWWSNRDVPLAKSITEYVNSRIPRSSRHDVTQGVTPIWSASAGQQADKADVE